MTVTATSLNDRLRDTAKIWARSQHELVTLAAAFADSGEWLLDGATSAAAWLAQVADVETSTAGEWVRIGRCLRSLPASADAFASGVLSYSKIRTLTRVADAGNEAELVELAKTVTASDLGRAIAAWRQRNGEPEAILRDGAGTMRTEIVVHVRGDGTTMDDGTPIPLSVIERIAPKSTLRVMIHDAEGRPINVSGRHRYPTERQKRVVKERDRGCVDCGSTQLPTFDHNPNFAITKRTFVDEVELRCAPCRWQRYRTECRRS